MKTKFNKIILIIISFISLKSFSLDAQEITFDTFYSELTPYGQWIENDTYGWVWLPLNTSPGWKPYTSGYWAYSDYGWTFISDEDWAWAVYHYGRWIYDDNYGWLWVPGTEWGPAWVAWRCSEHHIGWAPLPPQVRWSHERGIITDNFNIEIDIHPECWAFVEIEHFTEPSIYSYVINPARNITIVNITKNITNYTIINNKIINNNINISEIEKVTNKKIKKYIIEESNFINKVYTSHEKNNKITIYKPRVSPKVIVPPKNITSIREGVEAKEIIKRHEIEKRQLNDHYKAKMDELKSMHKDENKKPMIKASNKNIEKRHQEEVQFLLDNQKKEKQILENKHKNELDAMQNQKQNVNQKNPKKKKPL